MYKINNNNIIQVGNKVIDSEYKFNQRYPSNYFRN